MKRITLVVTYLVLVLLSSSALAYSYDCPCCEGDGPIFCTNIRYKYGSGYEAYDETYHVYYKWEEPYCRNCGEYVGTGGDIYYQDTELHSFRNNTCTKCGYKRKTGNTETVKDIPSKSDLQAQAYQMGDRTIGATATAVYGGNIRREPNEYADRVGKIQVDDTYTILDYHVASVYPASIWLKIDYGYTDAWVSASLVQITGAGSYGGGISVSDNGMIGREVRINVSSGRARTNPGTNYPIIEYVHQGDVYTVLDCQTASNGTIWYKIKKDENFCWISSGIAD